LFRIEEFTNRNTEELIMFRNSGTKYFSGTLEQNSFQERRNNEQEQWNKYCAGVKNDEQEQCFLKLKINFQEQ